MSLGEVPLRDLMNHFDWGMSGLFACAKKKINFFVDTYILFHLVKYKMARRWRKSRNEIRGKKSITFTGKTRFLSFLKSFQSNLSFFPSFYASCRSHVLRCNDNDDDNNNKINLLSSSFSTHFWVRNFFVVSSFLERRGESQT